MWCDVMVQGLEDEDRVEWRLLQTGSLGPLGDLHIELLEELVEQHPQTPGEGRPEVCLGSKGPTDAR